MRRGTNLPAVGSYNQAVLLDLIRRTPEGLSRVELAAESGLATQTVSNAIRRLMGLGLVRESGKRINGPGKPRTILELDAASRVAVGVHLDPTVIAYAVVDLDGAVVAHATAPTPSAARPDRVIAQMADSIERLLAESGVSRDRVLGVGIAAPGPIDRELGIVVDAPLLEGWHEVPLRDALGERLGLPVALEKDVTAAAAGELWTRDADGRDDFGVFYYGTGVGFGIALDHSVMRGASANIGDIGHLVVRAGGVACVCGQSGCLGMSVAPSRIVSEGVAAGAIPAGVDLDDAMQVDAAFTALMAAAVDGHEGALGVAHRAAEDMAAALVQIANLLDVSDVIFSGPFWSRLEPVAVERIRELVATSTVNVVPHPIAISTSSSADDAGAVGAACQILDAVLSPHPSALMITR